MSFGQTNKDIDLANQYIQEARALIKNSANPKQSIELLEKAKELYEKHPFHIEIITVNSLLSSILTDEKEVERGKKMAYKAIELAKKELSDTLHISLKYAYWTLSRYSYNQSQLEYGLATLKCSNRNASDYFDITEYVLIWAMYYVMTVFALQSFAPTTDLPLVVGLVVFVFGALGIVIPSPGGMGTYHALVIAALSLYGVSGDDGFSLANIAFFSINIFCNILFGILALILLPIINRKM